MTTFDVQYSAPPLPLKIGTGIAASAVFLFIAIAFQILLSAQITGICFYFVARPGLQFAFISLSIILCLQVFLTWLALVLLRLLYVQKRAGIVGGLTLGVITLAFLAISAFRAGDLHFSALDFIFLILSTLVTLGFVVLVVCMAAMKLKPAPAPIRAGHLNLLWFFEDVLFFAPGLIVLSLAMTLFVPGFREIFRDFRTNLPAITEFFLGLTGVSPFIWFFIAPLAAAMIALPGFLIRITRVESLSAPRRGVYPKIVAIFLFIFIMAPVVVAMVLPILKLMDSVRGGE